jgi:PKD repeat protein
MKTTIYSFIVALLVVGLMIGCKEDEHSLGPVPTPEDAEFVFEPTAQSDNDIVFTSNSPAFLKKWDLGNGQIAEGNTVTATYIFAGEYEVTLTVYTSGGSQSSTQTVVIEQTDLSKLPPVYTLLTGGVDYPEGKTWVIDATRSGHMGIGPKAETSPIWWSAPANDKADAGLYDDKHTFKMDGFAFIQETNGDVFINTQQAANFPGSYANKGDYTAPYNSPGNHTWSIVTNADETHTLNITNNGFIGYYTGVSSYQILSISETEMFIKFYDAANAEFAWFLRLIPDGFEPPPPPPPATSTLPLDFEGTKPPFEVFGGTAYDVVANPSSGGINTSAKVAKYVKGMDGNWAGLVTNLSSKLDFSAKSVLKYKVYSPVAGKALLKLEAKDNSAAQVTKVNEWEEIAFDFSDAANNTFDRIAVFLDFDNNNGGTFYFDDLQQVAVEATLTLDALTGGSEKIWKLKPAVGAFGVGPAKGSDAYWPNGVNVAPDRPCLFNDEFIFKTGNVYEYDSKGDLYGEQYMGLANGCTNETNLPTNAQAWGSGNHTFSFTPASGGSPATITVTGTGAFIALPKAFNGGEYDAAPPVADRAVTYEVLSYVKNGSTETLTITIDISGTGATFWNFTLISE